MAVSLEDFVASLENDCEYPLAMGIEQQVPVYDGNQLRELDAEQLATVRGGMGRMLVTWRRYYCHLCLLRRG